MASSIRHPAPAAAQAPSRPLPATDGLVLQPADAPLAAEGAARQPAPPEWLRPALALWLQDDGELGVRMGDGHAPLRR